MKDFSLAVLKKLLAILKECNYSIIRFDTYWSKQQEIDRVQKVVLLRHDVDRFPQMALLVAQMEAELDIFGTYFFRTKPHVFKPKIIKGIAGMGHEIGYHYECLADARGNFAKAAQLCKRDLEKLRKLYPVVSAAMHSRPLSKWDNRLFWSCCSLESFGIKGETYLSVNHNKYMYLADSGRNWSSNRNVVWDKVEGISPPKIKGTLELIEIIKNNHLKKIHLLIHPNRWPENLPGWISQYAMDKSINILKSIIRFQKKIVTRRKQT